MNEKTTKPTLLALLFALLGAVPGSTAPPPAVGTNFLVNLVTAGGQLYPAVAQDTAGDSVVAWLDGGVVPLAVKVRRFDPSGAPVSGEIVVGEGTFSTPPRVAMTPLGDFAVVWEEGRHPFLRRYDRLGRPAGDALDLLPDDDANDPPDVAVDAAGNAFVVWSVTVPEGNDVVLQRFDAASQPVGGLQVVRQIASGTLANPRVAVNGADSLLVTWDELHVETPGNTSWVRRFDGPSGTWAAAARVGADPSSSYAGGIPLLYPQGDGAVVFMDLTALALRARRIDAQGVPLTAEITVAAPGNVNPYAPVSAAVTTDGTALAAWSGEGFVLRAAFFDRTWNPLGADFAVSSPVDDTELFPAVAGGAGSLIVAWTSFGPPPVIPVLPGRDGSSSGVYAQRFQAPACATGSATLCLGDAQRFSVQVSWKNPYTGETGTGKSLPLTGDTGAFWFFDPANLELMIKILDGHEVNGNLWVFYGSLSNVEYTITVTDAATGHVKTYHNPALLFGSQADVDAFPWAVPASATSPAASRLAIPASAALTAPASLAVAAPSAAGDCTPTTASLCPQSRFRVEVRFVDPRTGASGSGRAVPLTDDTGVFWFFDPANLELMVKVLDGTAVNGKFWVFYGGLSDVDYTITVTDTATGAQRTYHNPQHHLASAADLGAF